MRIDEETDAAIKAAKVDPSQAWYVVVTKRDAAAISEARRSGGGVIRNNAAPGAKHEPHEKAGLAMQRFLAHRSPRDECPLDASVFRVIPINLTQARTVIRRPKGLYVIDQQPLAVVFGPRGEAVIQSLEQLKSTAKPKTGQTGELDKPEAIHAVEQTLEEAVVRTHLDLEDLSIELFHVEPARQRLWQEHHARFRATNVLLDQAGIRGARELVHMAVGWSLTRDTGNLLKPVLDALVQGYLVAPGDKEAPGDKLTLQVSDRSRAERRTPGAELS